MHKLIVRHAKQVVQVCGNQEHMLCGEQTKNIVIFGEDSEDVSLVVDKDGKIEDIGNDDVISKKYTGCQFEKEIDANGKCVLPGMMIFIVYIISGWNNI